MDIDIHPNLQLLHNQQETKRDSEAMFANARGAALLLPGALTSSFGPSKRALNVPRSIYRNCTPST